MRVLLEEFPKLNIAAVNIHNFPDDLAMNFIANGVNSYVNKMDGIDEYRHGLKLIRDGKKYVSPAVQKRIDIRREYPVPASIITERQKEVIRLTCHGFKDNEIADTLHISRRTVNNHKTEIYRSLNVRDTIELVNVAYYLGFADPFDSCTFPKGYTLNPKTIEKAAS